MSTKGTPVINPRTGQPVTAAQGFAAWLEVNEPALFAALLKAASSSGMPPAGLGDWSSILSDVGSVASSLGSGISDAASSVGNYLTSSQGLQSLSSLANTYMQTQAQQAVLQTQLSRAQQGLPPAPVSYSTNAAGQVVPVYTGASQVPGLYGSPVTLPNGTSGYPISTTGLTALGGTSSMSSYLPWILGGAAVLVGILFLTSRRSNG
jgi:hypothetical protein